MKNALCQRGPMTCAETGTGEFFAFFVLFFQQAKIDVSFQLGDFS